MALGGGDKNDGALHALFPCGGPFETALSDGSNLWGERERGREGGRERDRGRRERERERGERESEREGERGGRGGGREGERESLPRALLLSLRCAPDAIREREVVVEWDEEPFVFRD